MAVEKWTAERRRALTRSALLDAAEHVFAERGFQAAALDEIADEAGFTRGAIYSNFRGKEDLFLAVMGRRNEELFAAYTALLERVGQSSLEDVARLWSETQAGDEAGLRLMLEFRLLALRNETVRDQLAEFEVQTEDAVVQLVERLSAAAGLTLGIPAREFAVLLYASQQGVHEHIATCRNDHRALFQLLLELFVRSAT